jgi:predicted dehydrogenase
MSKSGKLRFGLVGCGAIGPTHAGALALVEDTELVAVADLVPERAKQLAAKFHVGRVYASDEALVADPEIDAVIYATPSGMHADQAIRAMKAGKHVVVEKPMDVSLAACDRVIAAERETGKKLAVISQHRFDHATRVVRDAVASGKLGTIVLADLSVKWWRTQQYYDSGDWRGTWTLDGGGALMNQGVHTVDLLQWLAGPVKTVSAIARTSAHERIEVEDVVVATLEFASGAVGTLTATTAAYDGLPARLDLFGTAGSAILEGDRVKLLKTKDGLINVSQQPSAHAVSVAMGGTASVKDETARRLAEAALADPGEVWGDSHREQLRDFVRAIRTNGRPLIDAAEGRKPVEIILAVYQSSRTGKPVSIAPSS